MTTAATALFDQALQTHRQEHFDEAEALYRQIPADHPKRAEALHLHGLLCHQHGRSASEALVGDLETVSRRMLAHCGLGWDARCLDFHRTERSVRTASMARCASRSIATPADGPMTPCWHRRSTR